MGKMVARSASPVRWKGSPDPVGLGTMECSLAWRSEREVLSSQPGVMVLLVHDENREAGRSEWGSLGDSLSGFLSEEHRAMGNYQ